MYAVGLMSGTSLDGIDAALVEITGSGIETKVTLLHFITKKLSDATLQRIRQSLNPETGRVDLLCSLNMELGYLFADAVLEVCQSACFDSTQLDFVASHGQTIYHLPHPEKKEYVASTLQLGEAAVICEKTKATVVSNFRMRDMAVGGEGAPIVPYTDYLLYRSETKQRLLQNIGGIGNVTVVPQKAELADVVAFDTGPGNMIIDAFMHHFYQKKYDANGEKAAEGKVNDEVLHYMMHHPYITAPYPKTTGREMFGSEYIEELLEKFQLAAEDWIATATAFTAESIALNIQPFITPTTELIVGGGGSYNSTLVMMLRQALPNVTVLIQEDLGYSSDAKEAIAMVILANETLHHQPSNVPSATGATRAVPLGSVTYYE